MPGFDKNRFIGVSNEDLDQFTCSICLEVFKNPVFSRCCLQTYCRDCINHWLEIHKTCPNDRKSLSKSELTVPPRALTNLLNKLVVKCNFHRDGCEETIKLDQLDKHLSVCKFNAEVVCRDCDQSGGPQHNCVDNLKIKNQCLNNENEKLKQKVLNIKSIVAEDMEIDEEMDKTVEEVDRSRAEATLTLKIENFTQFNETFSEPTYARNMIWRIRAIPSPKSETPPKYLGFFLQCNPEPHSNPWSCKFNAELKLVSQVSGKPNNVRKITAIFYPFNNNWGFTNFQSIENILDPDNGFIKDDSIILEVSLKADIPHGVK